MPIAARRAYVACGDTRGAPWVSYEGIRWLTWGTYKGTRSWCRGGWRWVGWALSSLSLLQSLSWFLSLLVLCGISVVCLW